MSATESELRQLNQLRHGLLALHKTLLDAERRRYEREHGRVDSRGDLLQLVVRHPEFAWIRALSAHIAQLDERAEPDAPGRDEEVAATVRALRTLIQPDGTNAEFTTRYWPLVELAPEALLAHVKLWRLISREA
jgi:hypothetical protein